jgi:GntP family gluconate:H+ symporter
MNDPSVVISNPVVALAAFCGAILLLLFLITKMKWHVFLALLLPVLLLGVIPGVERNNFISAFETGFGTTLGKIGVVIVLGSIIAEALKHTGAIQVITNSMVHLLGANRMPLALTLAGFVLGMAIFSDVAYVILNPLVHSAAKAMGVSIATMSTGLIGALQLTHAIVPPTPGPLAAAALLGADLGTTIFYGSIACLVGSLASWLWGQYVVGPNISTPPSGEFTRKTLLDETQSAQLPGTFSSYAPIAVPILLISAQSVARSTLDEGNIVRSVLSIVGWPVVALSIGVWLAFRNVTTQDDRKKATGQWVEDGLRVSAMILLVTGLGGSLSAILKGTSAVAIIADFFQASGLPAIFLPFVLGIVGNMITGSSTVGVITAASLTAPMLDTMPISPEAAMLSGGCGSVIFKYVNSSYFWVCTSLSGLNVKDALLSYGGATCVGGIASFTAVYVMWSIGLI